MADGGEQSIFTRRDCGRRGFANEEGGGHQHGKPGKWWGQWKDQKRRATDAMAVATHLDAG
jgi:hypothetical protein